LKKYIGFIVCIIFVMCIYLYAFRMKSATEVQSSAVVDYPAAIMVENEIYLLEGTPMPAEIDGSAIIGNTESYTDTFPEKNGETNFNRELGQPYARVENGIVVLYENDWYLCTPKKN